MSLFVNLTAVPVTVASPGTVTISAADPAVVTKTAHGLLDGSPLTFSAATTMPAGMTAGITYYVEVINANTFYLKTYNVTNSPRVATTTTGTGTITATATQTVCEINTENAKTVGIEVKNTGATALDLFSLFGKTSPLGNELALSALATDYTNAVYPVIKASASPVTLAAGATAWVFVDVTGLARLILKASANTTATTLSIYAAVKYIV